METEAVKLLAAGLCVAIGGLGPAIGEGYIGAKAMEAIGRNPQASDKIIPNMIVGMAICESISIYSLVISLILIFVA